MTKKIQGTRMYELLSTQKHSFAAEMYSIDNSNVCDKWKQ